MKKLYTLSFILLTTLSFGQAFTSTYDFAGVTTTSGLTDPSTVPSAPGITFSSFKAVNPTTLNSSGAGRLAIANQSLGATNGDNSTFTGAIDLTLYDEVTITPQAGYSMTLSQIVFGMRRSSTGTRNYAVRSSKDGYTTNLTASINPVNANLSVLAGNIFFWALDATANTADQLGSTITLSGVNFTGVTTPVTLRFYGWNAEATGGNFSIDDVVISGSTSTLSIKQNKIIGLKAYVNNKKLYITSDSNEAKSITLFDILGKQVIKTTLKNQLLNVENLNSGIYILKITENDITDTRKLIIE